MWWKRLAQVIENRGLRVDDVAKRANVPAKTLYGYLKGPGKGGGANPRGDTIKRLARAVGVTEAELLIGADVRFAQLDAKLDRIIETLDAIRAQLDQIESGGGSGKVRRH